MHPLNNKEARGGGFHLPQTRLHSINLHRITHSTEAIVFDPTLTESRIDLKLSILDSKKDRQMGTFYKSERPPYFIISSNPDTNRRRIALFDPLHRVGLPSTQDIPVPLAEGLILIEGRLNLWVCKRPESLPDLIPLKDGKIVESSAPDRARVIANWIHKFLNLEYP